MKIHVYVYMYMYRDFNFIVVDVHAFLVERNILPQTVTQILSLLV